MVDVREGGGGTKAEAKVDEMEDGEAEKPPSNV